MLLVAGSASLACRDDSPRGQASRENERGIAADALGSWPQARVHYDRSRAFGVRPEIPAYNLARSVTLQEDWSEAHALYQAALELAPRLAAGHFNDGHVLYRWGEAELDLEDCQLERALELWEGARRRFAGAAELFAEDSEGRAQARANLRFVGDRMAQVEEACAPPPPPSGGGGEAESGGAGDAGGEGGGSGGGEPQSEGDGEDQDGGGEEGEGAGREGGGEGEDEGEGGGEGENEGQGNDEGEDEGESGDEGDDEGQGGAEDEGRGGGGGEDEDQGEGQGEGEGAGGAGEDGGGGDAGGSEGEGAGGGGPPPLSGAELEQIEQALARIAAQRFADGRYHYRSLPEQFPRDVWENPEAEIWW